MRLQTSAKGCASAAKQPRPVREGGPVGGQGPEGSGTEAPLTHMLASLDRRLMPASYAPNSMSTCWPPTGQRAGASLRLDAHLPDQWLPCILLLRTVLGVDAPARAGLSSCCPHRRDPPPCYSPPGCCGLSADSSTGTDRTLGQRRYDMS